MCSFLPVRFSFKTVRLLSGLGIALAISVALFLRWRATPIVEERWLDTDVYRFVRQAKIIEEAGSLPKRDMMRWLPVGRDLSRQLSLSSYCLVGVYRVMRRFYPAFDLSDAALIYPLLCYAASLAVFYLLVHQIFDRITALIATFFFAIIPTAVLRSWIR